MLPFILVLFSCIPREDPPERRLVLSEHRTLPLILNENSGMTTYGGLVWFINDSGNDSVIYGYNRENRNIERTIAIKGDVNRDWEEITQNADYFFIGDFGNNFGDRRDLRIIRVSKADIQTGTDTITPAGVIHFSYSDQTDFTRLQENTTQYDCEAFIATSDELILFTKDWATLKTRVYTVPSFPGNYIAEFKGEWDFNGGLITGASWSAERNQLFLVGYMPAWPFILVFNDFDPETITYSSFERSDFMELLGTQTEAIEMSAEGTLFISNETRDNSRARLFYVREETIE